MDTIKISGVIGWWNFHGVHRSNAGVYTRKDGCCRLAGGATYAGGRKGGVAHGEGVLTLSNGDTVSGQFADGHWHGHCERHYTNGDVYYGLYERGKLSSVHHARVFANGRCFYDDEPCGVDHPDFAALQAAAQRAGVRT
jgi:hypothetical protein